MQPQTDTQTQANLHATVTDYLAAYAARDVERCLSFFHDDAEMKFAFGTYRGRDALTEWHQDRFAANLRVLEIENIVVRGNVVTVDALATSDTAKIWRLSKFSGRVTLEFRDDHIAKAKFSLRTTIPIEGW